MTEQQHYAVEIGDDAEKALERLPKKDVERIIKKIEAIADAPRPNGCKNLDGNDYRVRSGNYRIIYARREETDDLF